VPRGKRQSQLAWLVSPPCFAEEHRGRWSPPAVSGRHTVDDVADSLRQKQVIEGARKSYKENCESMQRVHISRALGRKPVDRVTTAQVEKLAESMLAKGWHPSRCTT
jgi:hypothetical protein